MRTYRRSRRGRRRSTSAWIYFTVLLLLLVLLSVSVFYSQYSEKHIGPIGDVIKPYDRENIREHLDKPLLKIASWNMQRFGVDKALNNSLMKYYIDVLKQYDVIVLQEVTDSTGKASQEICRRMEGYRCTISDRLGDTSYKEQYIVLYRNAELLSERRGGSGYSRSPYTYLFKSGNWSFSLTTIHTDPNRVEVELQLLEKEVGGDEEDHIVIGDLNADCSYYKTPPKEFRDWVWVIPDSEDTTVKKTDCAYDRIIINKAAANNYLTYGVMRNVSPEQSDHYLIYSIWNTLET